MLHKTALALALAVCTLALGGCALPLFQKPATEVPAVLTLAGLQRVYIERVGVPVSTNTRACFRVWAATTSEGVPFGERPVKTITQDELEVYFAQLREQGRAASTRNKFVQTVKMLFRWAVQKGHLDRNPAEGSRAIRREKHAQRNRRLEPGEEAQLLAHAGPHLYRLVVAALETGCRKGELLGLTWRDVDLKRREITLQAERTKTRTGRVRGPFQGLGGQHHQARRQLRRNLRSQCRRRFAAQDRSWSEQAVEQGRSAVRTAGSLIYRYR